MSKELRVPNSRKDLKEVIDCVYGDHAVRFFSPLSGDVATGLHTFRLPNNDITLVRFGIDKAAAVVSRPNALIAIESHSSDPNQQSTLAFREDISHTGLSPIGFISGSFITYDEPTSIQGEITEVSPKEAFVDVALRDQSPLLSIRPTWHTEDRMTFEFENRRSLVIRTDPEALKGGILFMPEGISMLNMGENRLEYELLGQTLMDN